MDKFEFFFTFYGLLLGFANLLRERTQPKWGLLVPLVGLLILIEISATFLDAWRKLQGIELNLSGFAVPTLIGIAYFVAAVLAVPRQIDDWPSLDAYFYARRRWIVGLLIAANFGHCLTEAPFVAAAARKADWGPVTNYAIANGVLFALYTMLLVARGRRVGLLALAGLFLFFAYTYGGLQTAVFTPGLSPPPHAPAPAAASERSPGSPPPAPGP